MGRAKLNDIEGTGELEFSEDGGVTTSMGWFKPDDPKQVNAFSLLCESRFFGEVLGCQLPDPVAVQVMGIDEEAGTVRITPLMVVWRPWIAELKHRNGDVRTMQFKWPSTPDEEHAATMLQHKVIPRATLLPDVQRGEREPARQRLRASGWEVIAIRPGQGRDDQAE